MATELKVSLTGDPRSLLEALQRSRTEALRTYGAMRSGVDEAKKSWQAAQEQVKALATAMAGADAPTKAQTAELDRAAKAAGRLKTEYLAARDAATRAQQGLRNNSAQITATQDAVRQADATAAAIAAKRAEAAEEQRLAAIVAATRARMLQAAQEQLAAERAAAAEAAAAARRQAENQAAATTWVRQYAAAKIAAEDRVAAFARRNAQQAAAPAVARPGAAQAGVQTISGQLAQARNIAAAAVGVQGVADLVRTVDAYNSLNARLKLATRSSQELAQAQRELYAIAQRNGTALADVAQFYTRIADPVRAMGLSQIEGLRVAEAVSQSLRISGASITESSAAMTQFAQALGKGIVNGDELQSILENAPRLARAMADGLGVPVGRLKDLGEQGSLTSAKVLAALRSQIPQINREAAQMPLTIGQAVTDVQSAFQRYIGGADESAGASRKVAGAIKGVADNFGNVASGVMVASSAFATFAVASRIGGAVAAAGSLGAAVASWPVLLALAASAGTALWLGMGKGAGEAKAAAQDSLAAMLADVERFGDRMSEAQRTATVDGLTKSLEQARTQLAGLSIEARTGDIGRGLQADIKRGEDALAGLQRRAAEVSAISLTKERSDLGVDKTKAVDLSLVEKGQADKLLAFDKLYQAFVRNSVNADGELVTSYQEVRAALDGLIDSTKKPAEFDALISRLTKALKSTPGGGTATLRAELANLTEARTQAEQQALANQVSGLQARLDRANKYFNTLADQARLTAQVSTGMARVTAELRDDTRALSADQAASARSTAAAVQQGAAVQIDALDKLQARKLAMIAADKVAASRVATNARIDAETAAAGRLRQLAAEKTTVAPDSQRAREIAAEEKAIAADLAKEKKRLADAGSEAQANAARRVADVERATGQQRLEILRNAQTEIASKANDALNAYKSYAERVIQLDRQIVANRLDTAASIESLRRKDMTPTAQADSLRDEMAKLRAEEAAAARDGDRTQQQEILGRQRAIANELAGVQGEGIDSKAMRQEAIDSLQRIGAEAGAILVAQRREAAAAAEEQKATYDALVANLQRLSVEIAKINQAEAIKLRAEVDMASVQGAVDAVRAAFASETFAIRVAATQSAVPTGALDGERRAAGGLMTGPGHDTSDNILTWTSPGEFVVKARAVRHYGVATLAALNRMNLPKFAAGGLVGGSLVSGLSIPSPLAPSATPPLQPMSVTVPGVGTYEVLAPPDVSLQMRRDFQLEALKRGKVSP